MADLAWHIYQTAREAYQKERENHTVCIRYVAVCTEGHDLIHEFQVRSLDKEGAVLLETTVGDDTPIRFMIKNHDKHVFLKGTHLLYWRFVGQVCERLTLFQRLHCVVTIGIKKNLLYKSSMRTSPDLDAERTEQLINRFMSDTMGDVMSLAMFVSTNQ